MEFPPKQLAGRKLLVAGLLVGGLAAAAGVALWHKAGSPQAPPPMSTVVKTTPSPAPQPPVDLLTVHISGAVVSPGLVSVAEGSRVAEVIAAAGGAQPGAELSGLNLAAVINDGDHLVVPWVGESNSPASGSTGTGQAPAGPVHLNRAGVSEMTQLPGVGEVIAARIVAYREANGPFRAIEDLLDVPGIGESKLAAIRDYAAVN